MVLCVDGFACCLLGLGWFDCFDCDCGVGGCLLVCGVLFWVGLWVVPPVGFVYL